MKSKFKKVVKTADIMEACEALQAEVARLEASFEQHKVAGTTGYGMGAYRGKIEGLNAAIDTLHTLVRR